MVTAPLPVPIYNTDRELLVAAQRGRECDPRAYYGLWMALNRHGVHDSSVAMSREWLNAWSGSCAWSVASPRSSTFTELVDAVMGDSILHHVIYDLRSLNATDDTLIDVVWHYTATWPLITCIKLIKEERI